MEIKSVDPPPDIRTAMEKQMRAERDRRAAILTAEGEKQAQILTAEGAKQAAVLTAEGERQAAILRAEGEAKAIDTVFTAIHEGKPDRELLSYEYLQMLPQLAEGDANKVFVVPSEFAQAFGGIGEALKGRAENGGARERRDPGPALEGPSGAAAAAARQARRGLLAREATRRPRCGSLPESESRVCSTPSQNACRRRSPTCASAAR